MPVAFWNTEKAVCAKSGFSFLGLLAFVGRLAFGMTDLATNRPLMTFNFQTDPLPNDGPD
jgi:hypothetical protein